MNVPMLDLVAEHAPYRAELVAAFEKVFCDGGCGGVFGRQAGLRGKHRMPHESGFLENDNDI